MNRERIFRIGTATACEIEIPEGIPANVVWVHLAISAEGMHLLTVVERGIVCCVNGNAVSQQYWVNESDIIEIEGRVLNWDYIRGDSNEPFKVSSNKRLMKRWIICLSLVFIVAAILVGLLYGRTEPPHIETASEIYEDACYMITSIDVGEKSAGYKQIETLAIDSLYIPAVLHYYESVLLAKDTSNWDIAYNRMMQIANDSLNLVAIYECALCMSYISPKLSLPEVMRYDFLKEKNYEEANRLFDIVISNDPYNYKAIFWKIINLITLFNGKSLADSEGDELEELYMQLDRNLSLSTEELAIEYKIETERVIKTILRNWQVID